MKKVILFTVVMFSSFFLSQNIAQDANIEPILDGGGEKVNWYYFDCPYNSGKECKTNSSSQFCAKSKTKPIGA
ncbi:hypothetical protein SAMN06295967_102147 [Belliella buryatensis]|uniref:NVEALA protein n=1 Tax=Belliella buryatensis TaxID=1500549 RepID=A0A239B6E6_9BACT|nr:hypothetical protein [Belliella buryatensis]SNS03252.1 hypothetical protein SAMN06295967_102147 [Belliella buryatensis]